MKSGYQTTLRRPCRSAALESIRRRPRQFILHPAEPDSGVTFLRTGLPGGRERLLEAKSVQRDADRALHDPRRRLRAPASSRSSICWPRSAGLRVDNVLVEIDGPETPIMDGSAAEFVAAIDQVGLVQQSRPRRYLKVLKPVRVEHDGGYAEFLPGRARLPSRRRDRFRRRRRSAGSAVASISTRARSAAKSLAPALSVSSATSRSCGRRASRSARRWKIRSRIDGDEILNPEGLRYADEFVRHKALDAIGDLSLAGAPIVGVYRAYRPGHTLNALALAALFAERSSLWVRARRAAVAPSRSGRRASASAAHDLRPVPPRRAE